MKRITALQEMRAYRRLFGGESVGFVPTMGALHEGHASLIRRARLENQHVVVSIYVNPTQFNNADDLAKYPRPIEKDLELADEAGADVVWTPEYDELYPDAYRYKVTESEVSKTLEGEFRPGHFDGMLSVVLKLLNGAQPTRAYFGEKDWQQLSLVRGMVEALLVPTEIVPVATLREADGLAMSSRNVRLSDAERKIAPLLHQVLTQVDDPARGTQILTEKGFRVEYIREWDGRRLAAAWLGNVRLIDNVEI
ncbi:MAG: pantoate--beta-alanine ligase [Bdellovibrionaceae bacterium]|nr:pantoate--beta-alanine ligase [Pseudobdellovibrionaceae bacterium]